MRHILKGTFFRLSIHLSPDDSLQIKRNISEILAIV